MELCIINIIYCNRELVNTIIVLPFKEPRVYTILEFSCTKYYRHQRSKFPLKNNFLILINSSSVKETMKLIKSPLSSPGPA